MKNGWRRLYAGRTGMPREDVHNGLVEGILSLPMAIKKN
jgi:hypothetical protein